MPGAPAGSTVNIQLRVWIGGATYETASAIGESNIIPLTLGGVLSDGRTVSPAILVGLQGFEVSGNASWFDSIIVRENSVSMDASYRHSFIPARGWILESSADFQSWQPISTNGIGSANLSFELPRNPTESVRIFRLRLY